MVRSHALYPIELRAHRGEIASSNYNGNKIISANLNRCPMLITVDQLRGYTPTPGPRPHSHFAPNPALAVEIGDLSDIEESTRLVN